MVDLLVEDGEVEGGLQRKERVPMEVGVVEVLPHQRALEEVVEVVVVEEGEGLQRKVVEALVEGGEVEPRLHKLEEGAVDMVAVVVVVALMEEMPLPMGVRVGGKAGEGLLPKKVGERKVEGKGATRRKVEVEVKEVVEVEKAEWEEVEVEVEVDKVSVHLTQIVLQVTLSALSMDSASANPTNQEARTAGGREWVEMGGDRVERGPKEKVEGEEGEEVVKGRAQLTATAPLRILFALSTRIFLFSKNEQTHNFIRFEGGVSVSAPPTSRADQTVGEAAEEVSTMENADQTQIALPLIPPVQSEIMLLDD